MIIIKTIVHMKNNIFVLAALALAITSCQKDEPAAQYGGTGSTNLARGTNGVLVGNLPATFTQKILAEEFTGKNYGNSPVSNQQLSDLANNNPGRIYISSMHNDDILETSCTDELVSKLSGGTSINYPMAMLNREMLSGSRFLDYNSYATAASSLLSTPANCGVAIQSTINGSRANITVFGGFNSSLTGSYTLNAYIVEDNITDRTGSLAQLNYFNGNKTSIFFQMGNPIAGYVHNNVMRLCLTPSMGTSISPSVIIPGGTTSQTFNIDIPGSMNVDNCYIIAFIAKTNNNIADEIMNVQKCRLGFIKSWN
jgi:hypothetical protein